MVDLIKFATADEMTSKMVRIIELSLKEALIEHGMATMALSGGSSPKLMYQQLSQIELPWENVSVTLVDERWVAPGEDGSNETFVRENLCANRAQDATLIGLYKDGLDLADAVPVATEALSPMLKRPFDVVVMGMGPDGHTASWFPGAENLSDILASSDKVMTSVVPQTDVTGTFLERMTLTPAALRHARTVLLPLKGEEKYDVYTQAQQDGPVEDYPVRALLSQTPDLWATWAP